MNGKIVPNSPDVNIQVETRYPFEVTCSIRTIEGVLERSAGENGVGVEYGVEPVSAELEDDGEGCAVKVCSAYPPLGGGRWLMWRKVKITKRHAEGGPRLEDEVVHAKFLIGSDGKLILHDSPLVTASQARTHGYGSTSTSVWKGRKLVSIPYLPRFLTQHSHWMDRIHMGCDRRSFQDQLS